MRRGISWNPWIKNSENQGPEDCYQRTGKGSGRIKGTAVQVYLLNCGSSDNFLMEEEYSDGVIPVTFLNCLEKIMNRSIAHGIRNLGKIQALVPYELLRRIDFHMEK